MLQSWQPFATPRFYVEGEHAGAPATLTVWDDLESVFAFAYYGVHGEALSKRKEWFVPPEWPTYVAWWVDDDHQPDWEEAGGGREAQWNRGGRGWVRTCGGGFRRAATQEDQGPAPSLQPEHRINHSHLHNHPSLLKPGVILPRASSEARRSDRHREAGATRSCATGRGELA